MSLDIRKKLPSWSALRSLGNSRLLRSSYFWLIAVPIAAKFLGSLPSDVAIPVEGGGSIRLILELPFSWQLFYYGAVFTALGNLIYSWKCPKIVQDYRGFADYADEIGLHVPIQLMNREMSRFIEQYGRYYSRSDLGSNLEGVYNDYKADTANDEVLQSRLESLKQADENWKGLALGAVEAMQFRDESASGVFTWIRDRLNKDVAMSWRTACLTVFVLGLGCFIFVVAQNIAYVISYSLSNIFV